jgi:hypothetical protein
MCYRREGDGEGGRWMGAVAVASPCAAPRRRPAPSRRARELQDGIRRVREEALIRATGGEEWPFQACFTSGPVQTERQFHARTVFNPGRTDPAGMAPGTGHSGKTERAPNRTRGFEPVREWLRRRSQVMLMMRGRKDGDG